MGFPLATGSCSEVGAESIKDRQGGQERGASDFNDGAWAIN